MGTKTESEFNQLQFEKKLTSLKDSQDSINSCCQWCLQNRQHHKKIVNTWLNVLKRVKVEQRLTLFYLANDVVQYSKRKNYEYVESWGTALQKATTMVRDEKVKHKILRIFKIWEQRGVYNEEFISDLSGLLSVVPSAPKGDEPHEFQSNYVINKIKTCSNLEKDTDAKLKVLREHNQKITIGPELFSSLKDRAHVDDVEKEIDTYITHSEDYINALKSEIKNRLNLISVLKQAELQLDSDRKDVKLVAHAYKMFGQRVKTFQKKLQEHMASLCSPVPSPDVNAPSPSPDSDLELPDPDPAAVQAPSKPVDFSSIQFSNAGFYNPVPPPPPVSEANSFSSNGFASFLGSSVPFNIQNLNFGEKKFDGHPPLPVEAPVPMAKSGFGGHMPLLPPPMPPFNPKAEVYGSFGSETYSANNYDPGNAYNQGFVGDYQGEANAFSQPPPQDFNNSQYNPLEEYNPEQDVETWEPDNSWQNPDIDTPESPPMFEKESFRKPVEYHDNVQSGFADVDHRVLPILSDLGKQDVDHRNLISLTGSPGGDSSSNWSADKDYRMEKDQDYRLPFNLNLPPPPPPPQQEKLKSPMKKFQDNTEQIDMDLSDDEPTEIITRTAKSNVNLKVLVDSRPQSTKQQFLEPPPPLPDLPEDVEANHFLDELNEEVNEFSNVTGEEVQSEEWPGEGYQENWDQWGEQNWEQNQNWQEGGFQQNHWKFRGRGRGFNGNQRFRGRPFRGNFRGWRGGRAKGNFRGNYRGNY